MRHWGECFFDLIPQGEVCPPPSVYKSNTRKKNTRPIKKDGCCKYFNKNRARKPYYTNLTGKTRYKRSSAEPDGVTTQG